MSERFWETLEDARKRVADWPDWKKSEALKLSEKSLECEATSTARPNEQSSEENVMPADE